MGDVDAKRRSREAADQAKHGLGEHGPVWWEDGAPSFNHHMARNTPYADWFAGQD